MKLSLNLVWHRTAALAGVSRSTAQKTVEQQQPKQPPSSSSKVSLDDFDQDVVRRTIASVYSLKWVLSTLDNIRIEVKQRFGYTGSKGRLPYEVWLNTLSGESNSADGETRCSPQQDQIHSQVRELRETGYTVAYTDETYVHTSHAVPKCWKDSTTGLKIPFSKGYLKLHTL